MSSLPCRPSGNWLARAVPALLALATSAYAASPESARPDAEAICSTEIERLQALIAADMPRAQQLHANDFQVINPRGQSMAKDVYLQRVASGEMDHLSWTPEAIDVRFHGSMAAIRYRSRVELAIRGKRLPTVQAWNTGVYERRSGRWEMVWFQVTEIASPNG